MEVTIKSRTSKNISYCFSDRSPDGLLKEFPHLANNFSFDPSNPVNEIQFREAINDCAHPELLALLEDGLEPVTRYIKAFGITAQPLYVYRIDQSFYEKRSAV